MASVFVVKRYTGTTGSPVVNPDDVDGNSTGFMHLTAQNVDAPGASDYQLSANQITIPASAGTAYSYEGWFRGRWTGTYNAISVIKFWKSAGSLGTGVAINWKPTQPTTFVTPINTAMASSATVPVAEPGGANVTQQTKSGSRTDSDYVVLQLSCTDLSSPGDVGSQTYSWKWTES